MKATEEPPPCLEYIWAWFADLSYDRENGMGLGYIPSSEYESWAKQNRVRLSISELAILKALDRAYVTHHNEKNNPGSSGASLADGLRDLAAMNKAKKKAGDK